MNRDANPFFGTAEVSGPDELLRQLDLCIGADDGSTAYELLVRCRTRIAANAALAARCEKVRADALEEAAQAVESMPMVRGGFDFRGAVIRSLRALASQAAETKGK